jgi:hypothetical protein
MRPVRPKQNYAGIGFDDNAAVTTIQLVNSYELIVDWDTDMPESLSDGDNTSNNITVGATGIYLVTFAAHGESAAANKIFEWDLYELDATSSAITSSTNADPVVVTATAHGFSDGDEVAIKGVTTQVELNNRIFKVADKADNTFELTDDGGASPGNDIDGTGHAGAGTGGTATLATKANLVHAHRKFSAGGATDIGSMGASVLCSLTKDKTLELYIKGISDATNFTHEHAVLSITRVD